MKGLCAVSTAMVLRGLFAAVSVYPDYPEAIERDGAYDVAVTQGGRSERLVVWNHCEKSILAQRTHGGDVNRRFCEFAFDGKPVRVDIAVKEDVRCYKVFPARLGLRHRFRDGVISVWLERPAYFGIQLNDSDKSILSVFADRPERDAPRKGAKGVLYVEGWVDATSADGVLETRDDVKEIYLAPGSVLNARLKVRGKGTRLHGRGMILDPMSDIFRFDQRRNTARGIVVFAADGCSADGVKLVDARTFNFIGHTSGLRYTNVKVLSSMMCSDGFTNGGVGLCVDNAWVYCGDNALVVSGARNATYRNIAIGTSCNAIFPQFSNSRVRMENVDVFRADEGLIANVYNGVLRRNNKWNEMSGGYQKREPGPQDLASRSNDFTFVSLSAVDCTLFSRLFRGWNTGTSPKRFAFDQLSIPHATGRDDWRSIGRTNGVQLCVVNDLKRYLFTSNYTISVTNLYLAGRKSVGFAPSAVKGSASELDVRVVSDGSPRHVPLAADRVVVNWACPSGRRRKPEPKRTNLLEDAASTRSIWQRSPSWMVKLDAVSHDEKGAVVYRLTQCEKGAGMQAVITERFRAAGSGRYRLAFDCRARGEGRLDLNVAAISNERTVRAKAEGVNRDSNWHHYELEMPLAFDDPAFDLLAIHLSSSAPAEEICLRNLSLGRRQDEGR